jgi:hypothetical protein
MAINPTSFPMPAAFSGGVDFSPLANLGNVAREARNQQMLANLGNDLASGNISYQQAAAQVAGTGDMRSTLAFLGLSEEQKKQAREIAASKNLVQTLQGVAGGGATTPPASAVTPPVRTAAIPPVVDTDANAPVRTRPDGTIASNIATTPKVPGIAPVTPPAPPLAPGAPAAAPIPAGVPAAAPVPGAPPGASVVAQADEETTPASRLTDPNLIPKYLAAAADPNLPAASKEVAKELLKRAFDNAKPTDKIATLKAMRDDPQLYAMEKDLRKSQAPSVNIMPGEKKYDEEMNKTLAEVHTDALKAAMKAPTVKATLDTAERAMSAPGFVSGTGAPAILAAQRAGVQLGLLDADKASPNELFQKLQNRAIMDAGGTASGLGPQISNNDARIIRDSSFNSTNSPEGNRKIIGFMRLMEDRKVDYAKELNKYANAHGGRIDLNAMEHMSDWAESHPLDFSKVPGFAMPTSEGKARNNVGFRLEQ